MYTEKDWNDTSTLDRSPYPLSKTEAERAAWNWQDSNKTKISFDIVTVNPSLVLGRHLNDGLKTINESNGVLSRIINGGFPVRLNVAFTLVDVRDVAAAHLFLIEGKGKETGLFILHYLYVMVMRFNLYIYSDTCNDMMIYTASGRHLCANKYMPLSTLMDFCDEYCGKRGIRKNIPCCRCDCSCCWCFIMCIACCQPKGEADYLRGAVNKGTKYSNAKLRNMGFEFRDNDSTLIYTLDYLVEAGFIGK